MTSASTAIKVVVLADALLPRLAWEALLAPQPGLELWGTVANLDDLLALTLLKGQTAVLFDCKEPLQAQVAQNNPGNRILVVTNIQYCHHIRPQLQQAGLTETTYKNL